MDAAQGYHDSLSAPFWLLVAELASDSIGTIAVIPEAVAFSLPETFRRRGGH